MKNLSNYELLRLQRIRRNNERLAGLGLLDKPNPAKVVQTPPEKKSRATKKKIVSPSPVRVSRRLKQQPALHVPSLDDDITLPKRIKITARTRRVHKELAPTSLSDAQKSIISSKLSDNLLDEFNSFLVNNDKISASNASRVMRQVTKLHNGEGVRAPHWPSDCYFLRGVKVDATSDVMGLIERGVECEEEWGPDLGNGWLYRHPLGKLGMFQSFLLEE